MNSRPFFFVFQKYPSAGWQKSVRVKSELKRMEKILLNTGVESKCQYFFSKQRYLLFMGVQQASKTECMVITLQYCQLLPLAFLRFAFCKLKCYCSDQYLLQYLSPFSH